MGVDCISRLTRLQNSPQDLFASRPDRLVAVLLKGTTMLATGKIRMFGNAIFILQFLPQSLYTFMAQICV
jgi:hypothetical protein